MQLIAIHKIVRRVNKKTVEVMPGTKFDCPEDEAQDYLKLKAATVAPEEAKAPAKKAPAKKAPAKKAAPKKDPEPQKDPEPAKDNDDEDMLD